ncbi:MAG: GlyGly-CTERM sorting domain-containing protein, partial [Nevskiales bacterium]|nr:GlyGly-CTERM sorting domain-containing protein [Nevskiales bacterium]
GSQTVTPDRTGEISYLISCAGNGSPANASVRVTVTEAAPPAGGGGGGAIQWPLLLGLMGLAALRRVRAPAGGRR